MNYIVLGGDRPSETVCYFGTQNRQPLAVFSPGLDLAAESVMLQGIEGDWTLTGVDENGRILVVTGFQRFFLGGPLTRRSLYCYSEGRLTKMNLENQINRGFQRWAGETNLNPF